MNLNELAREITLREGKKVEVNIAQIKEVLHSLGVVLTNMTSEDVLLLLSKLIRSAL